jgi:hypothetical protein
VKIHISFSLLADLAKSEKLWRLTVSQTYIPSQRWAPVNFKLYSALKIFGAEYKKIKHFNDKYVSVLIQNALLYVYKWKYI